MIKITYNREKNQTLVQINDSNLMKDLLPLRVEFVNIITKEIHYTSELNSNTWCGWQGAELITDVLVYTKDGNLLQKFDWNVWENGDEIEKALWFYLKARKNSGLSSNGLVIGSHDGRNGHWIYGVKENLTKATLIDGSTTQFGKLTSNYSTYNNVRLMNTIVTTDGSDVTWYTGGEGYTDTIISEFIKDWLPESEITKHQRKSISINELIGRENYDWLHLDVEGIDDYLIQAIKKLPNIIIFESMNIPQERIDKINSFFISNGFRYFVCNGNTLAYRI